VLFKQERVGLNRRKNSAAAGRPGMPRRTDENLGKLFTIYKFRTMKVDAEAACGPVWAKKDDDRITRVGRILRKAHLDEIPQFFNVLQGDMSIIGPRPERSVFVNLHKQYFQGRFKIRPGITGLAQTRQSYAATWDETRRKLRYDRLYMKKQSMLVDFVILMRTLRRVMYDNAAH
jgi:lipopolysaccharide/colanic/teichoic acid biosynthesis glycosyltransferase